MNDLIRRINSIQRPDDDKRSLSKITSMCGVNASLRDYQLFGVEWLGSANTTAGQHGCILGDEMGLGKTVQVRYHDRRGNFCIFLEIKRLARKPQNRVAFSSECI